MATDDGHRLPLSCSLPINGEQGERPGAADDFSRENPADVRQVATMAEEGSQADARAAIDAARAAFDGNVGN